ncbi:phenazine biosynthesis protein PhzF family [Anaerosphaera aminiphila DSM 21120]|uniref:Phenazine biosynthesis protein PhzF family n=1 Tax=Anaerosphaera aminiphila DSM 21120 TaxID=1120995 RepID=A0A1M5SES1_9FIRM|nr:PhzF family phenazine biosynthesis protein [Anaerosphaera aminiphila]SHH36778.1 phenazine biosynthesis protein PhzF family [Anaerosphaera aminiphila DSM 21120]
MRYFNMYLVNAFTDRAYNGNATGVILSHGKINDDEMQNIAKDLNQSETVFIKKIDTGLYSTRFFTPEREINLCGHATIATFYALCENEYLLPIERGIQKIEQLTKCGRIQVELEYNNYKIDSVYMILNTREVEKTITNEEIAKSLNIPLEDIGFKDFDLEPKKIETGGSDIVIPVKSAEMLKKIKPNYEMIYELSERENVVSFQVFTLESDDKVVQRTFSPSIGVNEEAGSGTSTGATMYYITEHMDKDNKKITSTQGVEINRKSTLTAEMISKDTVRVGGRAFVFMNGVLNI